eukprot:758184-Hanusia_phi.AAC.2
MKSAKRVQEEGLENVEDLLKDIASLQFNHELNESSSSYSSSDDSQDSFTVVDRKVRHKHTFRTRIYSFHSKGELFNSTLGPKKKLSTMSYDPFKGAGGKTTRCLLPEGRRRTILSQKIPKVECIPMTPDEGCDLDYLALPIEIQCPS